MMISLKFRKILYAFLFFALVFVCSSVNATTFYSIETRVDQNNKMLNAANSMGSVYRDSYLDLSLKELAETNYTGLTTAQQNKIKVLANEILEGNSSLTKTKKLEKFYDWILDNYYYYETPQKIAELSVDNHYNNPYYLLTYEYQVYGKVRARDNGYASTLIAFARTQNIPARIVAGHYNSYVRDNYDEWTYNVTEKQINHVWVEAYVNGAWKMFDPVADSYKKYDDVTSEYIDELQNEEEQTTEEVTSEDENENTENSTEGDSGESLEEPISTMSTDYQNRFFAPAVEELSRTHVAFKTYPGSKNIKYIANINERKALTNFLNIKYNSKSNGKRINSLYNVKNASTWFVKNDISSVTNGYGRVKRIYWPDKKGITGNLKLNSFIALENISLSNNKLKSANITKAASLKTANFQGNDLSKLVVTGSKKLYLLKAYNNSLTYAEFNFNSGKSKAIIKAGTGGTFSLKYVKINNSRNHYFVAKPKTGYNFKGWYKGNIRISRKATFSLTRNGSYTYVAKFEKKSGPSYIKISISKQKLWYYKKGKLTYTSSIVTGQRYLHDTAKGTYSIRSKSRNVYLVGPDYKSFVYYWMPIYGAVGLHDATWRWSFGGDIYTYNGSHGCVNLPLETAKYIYYNVPVGTTVKVVK